MLVQQVGENHFALTPKAQLFGKIIAESIRRREAGEDQDPLMVVADIIESGETVTLELAQFVWEAHNEGPWRVRTEAELETFAELCAKAGTPLAITKPTVVANIRLYEGDHGDCVLKEAARGSSFAAWTRKGRLYVGFKDEALAIKFRSLDPVFSMEATGNRHLKMVVIEGASDGLIIQACQHLNDI